MLAGFFGVVSGVNKVAMRHVGVVAGRDGVAGFVVLGGVPVMPGGVLVVFGGFTVVLCGFFRHRS